MTFYRLLNKAVYVSLLFDCWCYFSEATFWGVRQGLSYYMLVLFFFHLWFFEGFFFFLHQLSLHSVGWPWTHGKSPALASQVLGLQTCTTMPSVGPRFCAVYFPICDHLSYSVTLSICRCRKRFQDNLPKIVQLMSSDWFLVSLTCPCSLQSKLMQSWAQWHTPMIPAL